MLKTLRCTKCGNHTVATSAKTLAQRILCATCGHEIPVTPSPNLFERQGMMRMGDDDGGDWGGGGGDDDAGEEEEDDESEEGKKKKKKKKGFFAGLMGKVISALIGGVVLGAICCCAVVMAFFFPSHPLVGEWENTGTMVKVKEKVKEKDDKGVEVEKEVEKDVPLDMLLKIEKTDDKTGTGVYTVIGPEDTTKTYNFKWKDFDKEKKTVVFEMNNADDKFWKDIKSPATFTVDTSVSNQLKLTSGAETMTFTKVQPPPKEGGGVKKGGKRR
jgi:hypothetical protein